MPSYILKLSLPSEAVVDTYFKNPILSYPQMSLPKITILTHVGSVVTAKLGDDETVQTLTEAEAMAYINAQDGYSETP